MSTGRLDGQVALVTGGARGQGRAHGLALASEGATVVLCDIADQVETVAYPMATPADLEQTVTSIRATGGQADGEIVDVRDSAAVDALVATTISRYGRLDILIANAGITGFCAVAQMSDASWTDMIDTNLTGAFHCIRAVLPHMQRRRYGRIVTIASGSGRSGIRNLGHYGASKWGLIGLTKTVALEVATEGITANAICPTIVATPMVQNDATYALFCPEIEHPTEADARPRFEGLSPMGIAWLAPEDVTRAVLYLVTDPGYTSGTVLEVNLATSAART